MEEGIPHPIPRTVEEVFADSKGRRAGLVKTLTDDVDKFYQQCAPGIPMGKKKQDEGGDMTKSKDPFEIAFEEQEESPPESPVGVDENEARTSSGANQIVSGDDVNTNVRTADPTSTAAASISVGTSGPVGKSSKDDEEEEEEENMDVELGKFRASGDPAKTVKMQEILSHFTEEQMSRYESFRRSGFQKSNMKRLLTSITGSAKISVPMTIVVSGIAKMFVGELVETARVVMSERRDTGPIRPCHIREAYRRLKVEGKIPRRSMPRLFR